MMTALCSTMLFEFINLVYGQLIIRTRLIHQGLRNISADAAVVGGEPLGADLLAEQQSGVAVSPREHVDDAHRVDGFEHTGFASISRRQCDQADGVRCLVVPALV